jgi:uncharacterized membrane protein
MNHSQIIFLGIIFIFLGFFIVVVESLVNVLSSENSNVKFSFFGMIGPFPIGFSNDKKLFLATIIISSVIMFVILLLYFLKSSAPN